MEVQVENDLSRDCAVVRAAVESLSADTRNNRARNLRKDSRDISHYLGVSAGDINRMLFRHHQRMSFGNRPNIQKGEAAFVLVHLRRRKFAGDNLAKNAVSHAIYTTPCGNFQSTAH